MNAQVLTTMNAHRRKRNKLTEVQHLAMGISRLLTPEP